MSKLVQLSVLCSALLGCSLSQSVHAACSKTSTTQTEDSYAAKIIYGNINLPSRHLLPAGSIIDSKIIPPTAYNYRGANAESLLWTCDKSDLEHIYFMVATNGDDRVGGYWDIGEPDGLQDVYATYFAYIGLYQSMAGVAVTRYWKKIPITQYDQDDRKIYIRLKHLPNLEAKIYRISNVPPRSGANSSYCGTGNLPTSGRYTCNQPSAYIQLSGSDKVSFAFSRDHPGEDSAVKFDFWGADNGFGYGMNTTTNTLSTRPSCVVRNNSPLVMFNTVNAQSLNQGHSDSVAFDVQVECENSVSSGVNSGQTAIAFQPSHNAYQRALALGLSNSSGSVGYLLSDDYGQNQNLASGVGIELSNTATKEKMWLQNPDAISGGGKAKGWYPILDGQPQNLGETVQDHSMYMQSYQAELKALPSQQATPGKVKATATIVVKVQ